MLTQEEKNKRKKESAAKYRSSGKGKIVDHRGRKKYRSSEKGKETIRKYLASENCKKSIRKYNMLVKYGMTEGDYSALSVSQQNRCAICDKSIFENGRLLAVDHNHLSGAVRGLLCSSCNIGIGFMERPGFLKRALLYLGLRIAPWEDKNERGEKKNVK